MAGSSWSLNDFAVPIGVGAPSAVFIVWLQPAPDSARLFIGGLGLPAVLTFTQKRTPMRFAASIAAMLVAGVLTAAAQGQVLYVSRTFFGVYRVTTDPANSISHALSRDDPARHTGGRSGETG
jgi:hypothetical protein